MAEYIDRQAAIDATYALHFKDSIQEALRNLPAADVRPVVRGRWEVDGHHIRCTNCGEYMCIKDREGIEIPREFCPNCGADMREKS